MKLLCHDEIERRRHGRRQRADLNDRCAALCGSYGLRQSLWAAGGFKYEIETALRERNGLRVEIYSPSVECRISPQFYCKLAREIGDVAHNNMRSAEHARDQSHQLSDCATTRDQHLAASNVASAARRMNGDRKRFDHGGFAPAQAVRHGQTVGRGRNGVHPGRGRRRGPA